jgi:chemotaxis protein CheY-P-specific phosphatase CheC
MDENKLRSQESEIFLRAGVFQEVNNILASHSIIALSFLLKYFIDIISDSFGAISDWNPLPQPIILNGSVKTFE